MTDGNDNLSLVLGALDRRDEQLLEELRDLRASNDAAHEKIIDALDAKVSKEDCRSKREEAKNRLKPLYEILRIAAIGLLALAAGGAGPEVVEALAKATGVQ